MAVLKACHCCGLIHSIRTLEPGERSVCTRCKSVIDQPRNNQRSQARTAAASLAALALFPAAVFLPILEIEKLGQHHQSSVIGGILELFRSGNLLVGTIILVFSIVFPLAKIIALIELIWLGALRQRHQAWTYRWMEQIGKWSMMDVLLLAFFVMLIKLGSLVTFHYGPAVVYFTLCVGFSILASLSFDPHSIWDSEP
jgi:paraquat-inducible protein A